MTKKFKLSAKQAEAAGILSQGGTCTFAAETVGVTPQTISERKHNPAFEALINYMIIGVTRICTYKNSTGII